MQLLDKTIGPRVLADDCLRFAGLDIPLEITIQTDRGGLVVTPADGIPRVLPAGQTEWEHGNALVGNPTDDPIRVTVWAVDPRVPKA